MVYYRFAGLDLCYAGPARSPTTAGEELDDLNHDLSHLSEEWKSSTATVPLGSVLIVHPVMFLGRT